MTTPFSGEGPEPKRFGSSGAARRLPLRSRGHGRTSSAFALIPGPSPVREKGERAGRLCVDAEPSDAPTRILGFCTLSPASIEYSRTPALAKKGLARYDAPVFRLGRLAVDKTAPRRGLGGALLLRAADRCIRVAHDVGGVALLIDAKSARAARWYESYGALRMDDAPLSLVLPLAVAADALERGT